jgi:hypothetical protein
VIAQFENPLSTKENSIIDNRLVGHWKPVEIDKKGGEIQAGSDDVFGQYIIVGQHSEKRGTMIAAQTQLTSDGKVNHESVVGIATRLDNVYYLAWELRPKERNSNDGTVSPDTAYTVTTYTLRENDTLLTVFMIDHEHITEAVKKGRLAGVIEEEVVIHKGKEKTTIKKVTVESSTAELRGYFTKFGTFAFNHADPSYYRKVVK